MRPFVAGSVIESRFDSLVAEAYAAFDHPAVVPLKQLDSNDWLLELFHGPTLAFKDVAMQFLGRLSMRCWRHATSGSPSWAPPLAIPAPPQWKPLPGGPCRPLHPASENRVSEVQRRQMTTVEADNVHNLAVRGTFDDCQDL